jgi:hypothetical protein
MLPVFGVGQNLEVAGSCKAEAATVVVAPAITTVVIDRVMVTK